MRIIWPRAAASGRTCLISCRHRSSISSAGPSPACTDDEQDAAAARGVRHAQAVFDVGPAAGPFFLLGAGQPLRPVRVIDGVVDEHARRPDGLAGLLGRVLGRPRPDPRRRSPASPASARRSASDSFLPSASLAIIPSLHDSRMRLPRAAARRARRWVQRQVRRPERPWTWRPEPRRRPLRRPETCDESASWCGRSSGVSKVVVRSTGY